MRRLVTTSHGVDGERLEEILTSWSEVCFVKSAQTTTVYTQRICRGISTYVPFVGDNFVVSTEKLSFFGEKCFLDERCLIRRYLLSGDFHGERRGKERR